MIGPPERKKPPCGANQQRGQSENAGSEPRASAFSRAEVNQAVNFPLRGRYQDTASVKSATGPTHAVERGRAPGGTGRGGWAPQAPTPTPARRYLVYYCGITLPNGVILWA